jgi:hypothetical protein
MYLQHYKHHTQAWCSLAIKKNGQNLQAGKGTTLNSQFCFDFDFAYNTEKNGIFRKILILHRPISKIIICFLELHLAVDTNIEWLFRTETSDLFIDAVLQVSKPIF